MTIAAFLLGAMFGVCLGAAWGVWEVSKVALVERPKIPEPDMSLGPSKTADYWAKRYAVHFSEEDRARIERNSIAGALVGFHWRDVLLGKVESILVERAMIRQAKHSAKNNEDET